MSESRLAPAAAWLGTLDWRRVFNLRAWRRWFQNAFITSGRIVPLMLLIFVYFIRIDDPNWLQYMRAKVFDVYQQVKPRVREADAPVVIADIDEGSIHELGQWPWARTVLASLVTKLTEMGAQVVSFDVVFSEPDRTSLRAAAAASDLDPDLRNRLSRVRDNDDVFADAIKASGRVVLGEPPLATAAAGSQEGPHPAFNAINGNPDPFLVPYGKLLRPIPVLDNAAAGHGVFAFRAPFDGVVRDVGLVLRADDTRQASLALETLRVAYGARAIAIRTAPDGISEVALKPQGAKEYTKFKTDRYGQIRPYYAHHTEYERSYIPAADIIAGRVDPARIAGKIVLVGTSAQGAINDIRSTPLDQVLPGVEVHANVIETAMANQGLSRLPIAEGWEVIVTLALAFVVIIVTPWAGAGIGALSFVVLSGGMVWWSWNAFAERRELYDPAYAIIVAFLFYSFLTYAAFSREESQKKQIRGAFGQYLSPAVVEQLANDPSQLKLGGENRQMTFMFSDVRGFTTISELFSAEGLTNLINRLLTPLTDVILARKGTIDKYMGDCVMAFWNAPLTVKDHEREACRAAFEMLDSLAALNKELEEEAKREKREHRPLSIGVGINTGIACVGNMGSKQRFGYSVLGDPVNLASRLEGQSKTYGVHIVVGETTAENVQDFALIEMDLIKVKGKTEAVRIFTVCGDEKIASDPAFLAVQKAHKEMLTAYRAQNWDLAEAKLAEVRTLAAKGPGLTPELGGLCDLYAERIEEYRANPPGPNWDAVYTATSK